MPTRQPSTTSTTSTTVRTRSRLGLAVAFLALVVALTGAPQVVAPAAAERYTPPGGVITNNPLGGFDQRRAILRHLIRSVDAVPRKGQIRVASWNIRSNAFVDALARAHRRHVGVRVVLDRANANPENPNRGIERLRKVLRGSGNGKRRPALRSGVRKCVSACRARGGIAHSKFFLFSRAGGARYVVVNGSANATDLAAGYQWNDVYTVKGQRSTYRAFKDVFGEMYRDRNVRQPYRTHHAGGTTTMFFPYRGRHTAEDPTLRELRRIRCTGALNTGGGPTRVRIAMTSWHGERGKRIASKVRALKRDGCDIKIVYAVGGNEVLRILRSASVPLRQVVQDFNEDGVYDRYLHMKVMTVRGHYGRDRRAFVTINGSANWTPVSLVSDEALMRIRGKRLLGRYNAHIDRLFRNPPARSRSTTEGSARSAGGDSLTTGLRPHLPLGTRVDGVDPYALVQEH